MKKKVTYLFNQNLTKYQLSKEHFMKPRRIKMTHSLIESFQIDQHLNIINSREATLDQLLQFHHPHYVQYLQTWVKPSATSNTNENLMEIRQNFIKDSAIGSIFKVNQTVDCPGFPGLFNFCNLAAGGSIDAADSIISGVGDIAINWGGGFHHAKKSQASGFCYVNDIVLCILKLLEFYQRVLYLDIDVHHGDGVEEAFYNTNRVMTVSFHQFQEGYFPQTGALDSIGEDIGKYFTVNVPLKRGMDDESYCSLFKIIMTQVMATFVPDVVVIQCGADSLARDMLGGFNMSIKGHAQCLSFMKSFNVPLILLGGGGYTIENVARCWAYETAQMSGLQLPDKIPESDSLYYFYMKDNYKMHFEVSGKKKNYNTLEQLQSIVKTIYQNLRNCELRPSVPFHETVRTKRSEIQLDDDDEQNNNESSSKKFNYKKHIIRK